MGWGIDGVAPWDTWEWAVPPGTTGTTLAEQTVRESAALQAAVRSLSTIALDRPATFDRWSAHDVVAHCVAWAEICERVLQELSDGTIDLADYRELPVGEETGDELNERQVEQLRGVSVDMLLDRLDDAARKVAATLRGYPGSPPAELVLLTVGDHLAEHANDLRELAAADA